MRGLSQHIAIIDIVNRFGLLTDLQEWDALSELLADEVWFDYSSLDGYEAERVPKENLIRSWRELIAGFDAVQHLITNHTIDAQTARRYRCRAHTQIHQTLSSPYGGNSWTLGGIYTFGLERDQREWRIIRLKFKLLWSNGNRRLYDEAVERGRESGVYKGQR